MADIELPHGGRTLRRNGGKPLPDTAWIGTPVLTGAAATAGLQIEQIADEWNVLRWMLTPAGTLNAAPPTSLSGLADGTVLSGTVSDGTVTKTINVTIEADAYDVRPKWSGTLAEMFATMSNTVLPVRLGDKIRPQPGTYGRVNGETVWGQSFRFRTPQGTYNGSNDVMIEPRVHHTVFWEFMTLDSELAKPERLAYLHFKGITFPMPVLPSGVTSAFAILLNTNSNFITITHCKFVGGQTQGVPPYGVGRDMCGCIRVRGDYWTITDNEASDAECFVNNAVLCQGLTIARNTARNLWNDGIKTVAYGLLIEDNYVYNMNVMDPQSAAPGTGAHPDFFQHLGYKDGVSRSGFILRRNIFVRGEGRAGWPDGQGIFFDDSANGSQLLGVVVEDNIIVHTMNNGILVRNAVNPIIRNNTSISDRSAGPVVDTNTGTNPRYYQSQLRLTSASSGAGAEGGQISGNVMCNIYDVASASPPATMSSNITLSTTSTSGADSYADNFASPQFGAALQAGVTAIRQYFKPKPGSAVDLAGAGALDTAGNWRVFSPGLSIILAGPTGGAQGVPSTDFSVGCDGEVSGSVVVTPSDNGAGGTFTPETVTLSAANPVRTFTYTPPAGSATRTISVTNNGGLTNPAPLPYLVNEPAITTITLSGPDVLVIGSSSVITATVNGAAPNDVTVTLTPVSGLTFGGSILIEAGTSSGETTVLATSTGSKTIAGSDDAGLIGPASIEIVVVNASPAPANLGAMVRCGFIPAAA